MNKLLDIIIPHYNENEEKIKNVLSCISKQRSIDFKKIGVIFVNDNPKFRLRKGIFRNYPKLNINYIENPVNVGPGVSRQNGFNVSTAEYVTFLDCDDEFVDNDCLNEVILALEREKMDILTSNIYEESLIDGKIQRIIQPYNNFLSLHGLFVRRQYLLDMHIEFHPELRHFEDSYFVSCLYYTAIHGWRVLNKIVYLWKYNETSIVRKDSGYDYTISNIDEYIKCIYYKNDYLKSRNPDLAREMMIKGLFSISILWDSSYFNAIGLENKRKEVAEKILEMYEYVEKDLCATSLEQMDKYQDDEYKGLFRGHPDIHKVDLFDLINRIRQNTHRNFLDIIMPQYKETEEQVRKALDSIYNQKKINLSEINVYLINDCSDMCPSNAIITDYPKLNIHIMKNRKNLGPGLTRQFGIDCGAGEYITFLDADDEIYGVDSLSYIIEGLKNNPDMNILVCDMIQEYYEEGIIKSTRVSPVDNLTLHGLFVKRDYLMQYNIRFSDRLFNYEDSYFVTILSYKANLSYVNKPIYLWKYNMNSITKKKEQLPYDLRHFDEYILSRDLMFQYFEQYKPLNYERQIVFYIIDIILLAASDRFVKSITRDKDLCDIQQMIDKYKDKIFLFGDIDVKNMFEKNLAVLKTRYNNVVFPRKMEEALAILNVSWPGK